jgi:hypothetical protein
MATGVLYVRIEEDLLDWIREQSGRTGMPMARVTEALLAWARGQGAEVDRPAITFTQLIFHGMGCPGHTTGPPGPDCVLPAGS